MNLEKIFKVAQETKREETFHLPETIYEIIQTKVPHLTEKRAKKVADTKMENDEGEETSFKLPQFIAFIKKQNAW